MPRASIGSSAFCARRTAWWRRTSTSPRSEPRSASIPPWRVARTGRCRGASGLRRAAGADGRRGCRERGAPLRPRGGRSGSRPAHAADPGDGFDRRCGSSHGGHVLAADRDPHDHRQLARAGARDHHPLLGRAPLLRGRPPRRPPRRCQHGHPRRPSARARPGPTACSSRSSPRSFTRPGCTRRPTSIPRPSSSGWCCSGAGWRLAQRTARPGRFAGWLGCRRGSRTASTARPRPTSRWRRSGSATCCAFAPARRCPWTAWWWKAAGR